MFCGRTDEIRRSAVASVESRLARGPVGYFQTRTRWAQGIRNAQQTALARTTHIPESEALALAAAANFHIAAVHLLQKL